MRTSFEPAGPLRSTLVRRFTGSADPDVPGPGTGAVPAAAPGRLTVHVIDVGQGDAILIRCPEGIHELLIDAGELNNRYANSATNFRAYLAANQAADNPIEVVFVSHPHSDHIGSMEWVLDTFRVGRYVDNEGTSSAGVFGDVEAAVVRAIHRGTDYWGAQEANPPDVDFCTRMDVSARVLRFPGFGNDTDPNNNSVIIRVDFLEDSFLFVGDAEGGSESSLGSDAVSQALLDTDFIKVGHHGSDTSSTQPFLNRVTPVIAAISAGDRGVGTNSNHKHPRSEIVRRFLTQAAPRSGSAVTIDAFNSSTRAWESIALNRAVYVTAAEGTLVFESDGHGITKR